MNKHIELVEKWLADNDSVSLDELEANRDASDDAYIAALAADADAADAADYAASAADYAYAAARTSYFNTSDAIYYVERYKELTK